MSAPPVFSEREKTRIRIAFNARLRWARLGSRLKAFRHWCGILVNLVGFMRGLQYDREQMVKKLQSQTAALNHLGARVQWYEKHIPGIKKERERFDREMAKQATAAEKARAVMRAAERAGGG
jgi:cell division protein FtsB